VPHRTVPSFTVEIKRARKLSAHPLSGRLVALDFETRHRPKTPSFKDLFAATKLPAQLSQTSEATHDGSQARVGRILPSLASAAPRIVGDQQETKERPARRRMTRKTSGRVATADAPASATMPAEGTSSSTTAEGVPFTQAMGEAHVVASDSAGMLRGHVNEPRKKKDKGYWVAYRKAVRRGRPLPRLQAGERWKRRLPPSCR
jgi:hypothetical protein